MILMKDVVAKHRPSRVNDITDQQIAYIPRLEEDQVECSIPYYVFEGRKTTLDPKSFMIFKLRYLYFNESMNSIKRRNYRSCNESLMVLIDKKVLKPFMLFINGRFVPWVAIRIVIDNDNYYLIVQASKAPKLYDLCESYEFVQMFSLPEQMGYLHDSNKIRSLPERPVLMFKQDLTYTAVSNNVKYAIYFTDSASMSANRLSDNNRSVSCSYFDTNDIIDAIRIYDNNEKIKISDKNIFLFVEGLLHYGEPRQIKRSAITSDYLSYRYSGNIQQNMPIRVDGNLLSVNGGNNPERLSLNVVLFRNNDFSSNNLDNVMRISEESRIAAVKSSNNGTNLQYFQKISVPFDIPEVVDPGFHIQESGIIKGYNPYLYNELVRSYSTIDIQELKGSDILKIVTKSNIFSIALGNDGVYEERLLLFVNGILHANHDLSVINRNTMNIPINSTISANDVVEIMRFKNVNNRELDTVINEDDGFVYQFSPIINPDMCIFCKTPSNGKYVYPETGYRQFEVEYTLEQNEDGYIKISLSDPFYYGKDLTIVSKNRFVYKNFRINRDDTDTVNMGSYFKFCIDVNRYMVFVNGRLLNRDQYTVAIPCDANSKNYEFILTLNTSLKNSDKLDVVYTSTELEEFITQYEVDPSGDIVVTNPGSLDYIFSKELYMVWINGKKIPMSQLDDINTTCIRINTDQHTTNNLRVFKYIECDVFKHILYDGYAWDQAIFNSGLANDEINRIIGKKNIVLTNTEPNYGGTTTEHVVSISDNVLILYNANSIMTFSIVEDNGILEDPSGYIYSNIDNDILHIGYEGSKDK